MTIEPGQSLLHYRLVSKIGEGGMGAVWRAEDTTLDRQVAIKILPQEFAANAERLARFEREAKVLAALNHPNIAAIYGLHEAEAAAGAQPIRFLAMEMVEGEDLAQHLAARGHFTVEQAVSAAAQICEALETAHEQGIIHRDLKPANVLLAPGGKIKVLDFGLAKALSSEESGGPGNVSMSPTVTSGGTRAGVILGTAAYMSPEQARGEAVDQRTDIWAFGCLLFEMLTNRAPFAGKSVTDLLAAVVRDEPDWNALPTGTPAALRRLLRHCLAKDPQRRLRHMGDAGLALADAAGDETDTAPAVASSKPASHILSWILAFVAIAATATAVVTWTRIEPSDTSPLTRVDLRLAGFEGTTNRWGNPPFSLSPDGRTVAYERVTENAETVLAVRSLDSYELRQLPGTEGAMGAFFSTDGQWLGFFTHDELRKVPVSGQGSSQTLHRFEAPTTIFGATWTPGESIVFGVERVGLLEVPATGGAPATLTVPDPERGELHHGFPSALPDGEHLLFNVAGGIGGSAARLAILSRGTGEWSVLAEDQYGVQPRYLPSGHLVFANGESLLAAPFDPVSRKLTRSPVVVVDELHVDPGSGVSYYSLSSDGSLLYLPAVRNRLVWVDRQGAVEPILDIAGDFLHPRLSPDGTKVAILFRKGADTDLWVVDARRHSLERLTRTGDHSAPLWTVDGESIAYGHVRRGIQAVTAGPIGRWKESDSGSRPDPTGIYVQRADGSGEPQVVFHDRHENWPASWSPDGTTLAFERRVDGGALDIVTTAPGNDDPPQPLVATPANEESPRISPDGRWLAFVSDHSGEREVYIASYPALDRRWQISTGGGAEPVWNPDGGEIFYRDAWKVLAVSLNESGGDLSIGRPTLLFEGSYNRAQQGHAHYDVTPDGQRFVMVAEDREAFQNLRVALSWARELRDLVPE